MAFMDWFWGLFAAPEAPPPAAVPPAPVAPLEPPEVLSLVLAAHAAHNEVRRAHWMPPLLLKARLGDVAQGHAEHMARADRLLHSFAASDTPMTRLAAARYLFQALGENVACGRDLEDAMADWLDSPGHLANIINEHFWDVGYGAALTADGRLYWCVVFTKPAPGVATRQSDVRIEHYSAP